MQVRAADFRTLGYCLLLVLAVILAVWAEARPASATAAPAQPASASPP